MFARPMMAYQHTPGGNQIVGDLATGPGVKSNGGKTWTYTLRDNATFEDGKPITSGDVRWAIERSNWSALIGYGPTYFRNILTPRTTRGSTNLDVYKSGDKVFDAIIVTTDPRKIIFNLPKAFGEFDYVMTLLQTAPVERGVDAQGRRRGLRAGARYPPAPTRSPTTTRARTSSWCRTRPTTRVSDPNHMHQALVDAVDVQLGVGSGERDQELLDGQADADLGSALTVANHAKVLQDKALKSQTDDAPDDSISYSSINAELIPDVSCRQAIEYAVDKNAVQDRAGRAVGRLDRQQPAPARACRARCRSQPTPSTRPRPRDCWPRARRTTRTCSTERRADLQDRRPDERPGPAERRDRDPVLAVRRRHRHPGHAVPVRPVQPVLRQPGLLQGAQAGHVPGQLGPGLAHRLRHARPAGDRPTASPPPAARTTRS